MYIFIPMYLWHFKDILTILIRQMTNITNSKQVHLNTHTAWMDRVTSRDYVSFNDTDVLYHVSSTTSSKWKHRTYKCTVPCSFYKRISRFNCRRRFYLFVEVTQLKFLYIERWLYYDNIVLFLIFIYIHKLLSWSGTSTMFMIIVWFVPIAVAWFCHAQIYSEIKKLRNRKIALPKISFIFSSLVIRFYEMIR